MANPFDSIWEDRPSAPVVVKPVKKAIKPKVDHTEAKKIYEMYLIRVAYLKKQQAYAERVVRATHAVGMTPVEPLATMGTNGGPLLCDHCHKPIILEGQRFDGVYADKAWAQNPQPGWKSYIKGGMVVQIMENDTLRIYHGYLGASDHCCTLADAKLKRAEGAFIRDRSKDKMIIAFLEDEFPDRVNELLTSIMNMMFSFDPGFGVNRG